MSFTTWWRIFPTGREDRGRGVRHEVVTKVSTLGVSIICRFDHILDSVCSFVCLSEECLCFWPLDHAILVVSNMLALKCFFAFTWTLFFPVIKEGICFIQKQNFFKKLFLWPLNLRHHCICRGEIFQCNWCDHENTSADTFTSTATCYNLLTPSTARLHFVLAPSSFTPHTTIMNSGVPQNH